MTSIERPINYDNRHKKENSYTYNVVESTEKYSTLTDGVFKSTKKLNEITQLFLNNLTKVEKETTVLMIVNQKKVFLQQILQWN